jgi:hypothetical protein
MSDAENQEKTLEGETATSSIQPDVRVGDSSPTENKPETSIPDERPTESGNESLVSKEGSDTATAEDGSIAAIAKGGSSVSIVGKQDIEKQVIDTFSQHTTFNFPKAQQVVNLKQEETPRILFKKLSVTHWREQQEIFVPSPAYKNQVENALSMTVEQGTRILLIAGPEHSGRTITAINLGLELCHLAGITEPQLFITSGSLQGRDLNLLGLPHNARDIDRSDHELDSNAIFLLNDSFRSSLTPEGMSRDALKALQETLQEKNDFIILTLPTESHFLDGYGLFVIQLKLEEINLKDVFEKHLQWWRNQPSTAIRKEILNRLGEQPEIASGFKNSNQIVHFFDELRHQAVDVAVQDQLPAGIKFNDLNTEERIEKEKQALGKIARRAYSFGLPDQEPTRLWFEGLSENARLFAMLIVLLEGISAVGIEEIYTRSVHYLSRDGVQTLKDPRQVGRDDILSQIRARVAEDDTFVFYSASYTLEAKEQVRNHHSMIWSLIGLFENLIQEYKSSNDVYAGVRRSLGTAIGRMGIHHLIKLEDLLSRLIKDPARGVIVVAGYILDALCAQGPAYHTFVVKQIDAWARSGDPAEMWAAGAAIWRVYDGLSLTAYQTEEAQAEAAKQAQYTLSKLHESLVYLVTHIDRFNGRVYQAATVRAMDEVFGTEAQPETKKVRLAEILELVQAQRQTWIENILESILHALRMMRFQNARNVVELITPWLKDTQNENLNALGRLAGYQAFQENSHPKIRLRDETHQPLLGLISSLIETDSEISSQMMRTLLLWLGQEGWAARIKKELFVAVNHASPTGLERLRTSLELFWLGSTKPFAHEIAKALLTRIYVLCGAPVMMSGRRGAVLALDVSRLGRQKDLPEIGRRLFARLDARIDTTLVALGQSALLASPGQSPQASDLQPHSDRPRLLLPPLEHAIRKHGFELDLILVFTLKPILDGEDLTPDNVNPQRVAWSDLLVLVGPDRAICWKDSLPYIPLQTSGDVDLETLDYLLDTILGQRLAEFSAEEWWTSLQPALQVDYESLDSICSKLEGWAASLNEIASLTAGPGGSDQVRSIACGVLWLAQTDLVRCTQLLHTWLEKSDSDEDEAAFSIVKLALASCGMLYIVYGNQKPLQSVQELKPLLELAHLYVRKAGSWKRIRPILLAIRNWLEASLPKLVSDASGGGASRKSRDNPNSTGLPGETLEWLEAIRGKGAGLQGNLLKEIAAVISHAEKVELDELVRQWLAEKALAQPVRSVAEELQLRLAFGKGMALPALEEGRYYGLILLDSVCNENPDQEELAVEVFKAVTEKDTTTPKFKPILFRLGQTSPLVTHLDLLPDGAESQSELLHPPPGKSLTRLAIPILDKVMFSNVGFLLLLCEKQPLDWEDREKDWNQVLSFQYPPEREIPGWKELDTYQPKVVAEQITEFLYQRAKG